MLSIAGSTGAVLAGEFCGFGDGSREKDDTDDDNGDDDDDDDDDDEEEETEEEELTSHGSTVYVSLHRTRTQEPVSYLSWTYRALDTDSNGPTGT